MIQIQAIYEDGVLKPLKPLPLTEHQRVSLRVSLEAAAAPADEEDDEDEEDEEDEEDVAAIAERQRRAMEELDAELAALPDEGSENGESFFDAASRLGFIGCIHGTPSDLSTNKQYLDGLGKHGS